MPDLAAELRAVPTDDLAAWMITQRWFGSKAREMREFGVLDVIDLDERLACAIVEAEFHAGTHDLYQLLIGQHDGGMSRDALVDEPELASVLVSRMLDEARLDTDQGCLSFNWTGAVEAIGSDVSVRSMGAEQSNTSVVLDNQLVLKVFRRLEPGDNPELELLRFLSARGFPHIAALAGWYSITGDRLDATMGILQQFIADARDGWDEALDAIAGGADGFTQRIADLGRVTGELHTMLGSDLQDPDFSPEEPSEESLSLLTATIDETIERTFLELPSDNPALAPILGRGEEVRDRLQLLSHASVGGRLIRHHGDYHLGQCLLTPRGDWIILDFEGEPARSLLERRRKRSPLRDVAGMLRSFAYAGLAAPMLKGVNAPDGWEDAARSAFLGAYMEAVEPALLPAGQAATTKLLSIFELEKAVYELRYELNNRPDWVGIPVAGIARLLDLEL